ncbi:MAG: hypothetical protein IPH54_14715 [Rhodoferax sp.]|nr:hypothetical protein [Rhodoferax sp.]
MNEQSTRTLGIIPFGRCEWDDPMVNRKSDFIVCDWLRSAQIPCSLKNQLGSRRSSGSTGRITLFQAIQDESLPRFQAWSQIVCGKNTRLRKESLEHDIPLLKVGGIPVFAQNYVAIEMSI